MRCAAGHTRPRKMGRDTKIAIVVAFILMSSALCESYTPPNKLYFVRGRRLPVDDEYTDSPRTSMREVPAARWFRRSPSQFAILPRLRQKRELWQTKP